MVNNYVFNVNYRQISFPVVPQAFQMLASIYRNYNGIASIYRNYNIDLRSFSIDESTLSRCMLTLTKF